MSELEKPDEPKLEDFLKIFVVQQQRIYDVLLVLLADQNREAYASVRKLHEEFQEGPGPAPYMEA